MSPTLARMCFRAPITCHFILHCATTEGQAFSKILRHSYSRLCLRHHDQTEIKRKCGRITSGAGGERVHEMSRVKGQGESLDRSNPAKESCRHLFASSGADVVSYGVPGSTQHVIDVEYGVKSVYMTCRRRMLRSDNIFVWS